MSGSTLPPARWCSANLHAAIWWGLLMLGLGGLYSVKFRPGSE